MTVGTVGLGYVGLPRRSPALKLIEALQRHGAGLTCHDPFVPEPPEVGLSGRDLAPNIHRL